MSLTHVPTIERLATELADEIRGSTQPLGPIWRVTGDWTSGKSALLRHLTRHLCGRR